jgi:hypothetical protein
MNYCVAVLHALIKPGTRDNVASNKLEIIFPSEVLKLGNNARILPRQSSERRSDGMTLDQQSLKHVFADKASSAGEEDFHGRILNVRFLKSRPRRLLRVRDPYWLKA